MASVRRGEQIELAKSLRDQHRTWTAIAAVLRDRYGVNGRVAMRLAHGWSQADAAAAWNARWPDAPKTFKNISYWENWPGATGHAPSLSVLDRLAQLYECDVADLVVGWGEHRSTEDGLTAGVSADAESETMAWQVRNLDLHELTRALTDWSLRLPESHRQSLLVKLSTAAALSSASGQPAGRSAVAAARGSVHTLAGSWTSTYQYASTSRGAACEGIHTLVLRADKGRLIGQSVPHPTGSELELDLSMDGNLATGSWTERTSPHGHYRAAVYHGVLQLVVDPIGRSMTGMWLGVSKRFTIKTGSWRLDWEGPAEPDPAHPR